MKKRKKLPRGKRKFFKLRKKKGIQRMGVDYYKILPVDQSAKDENLKKKIKIPIFFFKIFGREKRYHFFYKRGYLYLKYLFNIKLYFFKLLTNNIHNQIIKISFQNKKNQSALLE